MAKAKEHRFKFRHDQHVDIRYEDDKPEMANHVAIVGDMFESAITGAKTYICRIVDTSPKGYTVNVFTEAKLVQLIEAALANKKSEQPEQTEQHERIT